VNFLHDVATTVLSPGDQVRILIEVFSQDWRTLSLLSFSREVPLTRAYSSDKAGPYLQLSLERSSATTDCETRSCSCSGPISPILKEA